MKTQDPEEVRLSREAAKSALADKLDAIAVDCSRLPVLDDRDPDKILGYDENGVPG